MSKKSIEESRREHEERMRRIPGTLENAEWQMEEFSEGGEIADRRIRAYAKEHDLSYEDATDALSEELAERVRVLSAEEESRERGIPLSASDEDDLDRRARRLAEKHGIGYAEALAMAMGGDA